MPSIKGAKRTPAAKKSKKGGVSGLVVALAVLITLVLTSGAFIGGWVLFLEERMETSFLANMQAGESRLYKATRDIEAGEYVMNAVELVTVPKGLIAENALSSGTDISDLKCSSGIKANTILTSNNTYNPELQDIVIDSTREVRIDYIETPGYSEGDFIDIRLQVSTATGEELFHGVICSKKEIKHKGETGEISLELTEADILNINSAVMEVVNPVQTAKIYAVKYVDPANQPKSQVNYEGPGTAYTAQELREAQEKLKEQQNQQDNNNEQNTQEQRESAIIFSEQANGGMAPGTMVIDAINNIEILSGGAQVRVIVTALNGEQREYGYMSAISKPVLYDTTTGFIKETVQFKVEQLRNANGVLVNIKFTEQSENQ